jgi:hypothetical protein
MVRMLQIAFPKDWEKHLHNLGVTASANPPPADLDRIMERVSWMVPQAGIKNPAAWIAFDMARVEAALASVGPEAPLKVALDVAVRQNPVELEPVKLGTDLARRPPYRHWHRRRESKSLLPGSQPTWLLWTLL